MQYQDIVKSLSNLSLEELYSLNKVVIQFAKQRRTVESLTKAADFRIGDKVTVNLKGTKWHGASGIIREMGRTGKATIAINDNDRNRLKVPSNYLTKVIA